MSNGTTQKTPAEQYTAATQLLADAQNTLGAEAN